MFQMVDVSTDARNSGHKHAHGGHLDDSSPCRSKESVLDSVSLVVRDLDLLAFDARGVVAASPDAPSFF